MIASLVRTHETGVLGKTIIEERTMKHFISIICGLVLAISLARSAEAPVRVAPGLTAKATLAPTADGYGLVWWDFRDAGSPERPEGGLRSIPLDAAGQPVGTDVPLEIHDAYDLAKYFRDFAQDHLEHIQGGFLLFAQVDGYELDTLVLDGTGHPRGSSYRLLFKDELYAVSVAHGPGALVTIYPEWYGSFQNWSQVVDEQGHADGIRLPLALPRSGVEELYDLDSTVAPDGPGFVAVWNQFPLGIRLREMSPNGSPVGAPTLVHPDSCTKNVAVAATAAVQAIVYSEGCDQTDVFLLLRDRKGRLAGPVTLTAEPYDEGYDRGFDILHPLRLASTGSHFAALYEAAPVDPYHYPRWFLLEFDEAGNPIGSKRDLGAEFGLQPYGDEVDFSFDERRNRYVLAWGGSGPDGDGVYVLALSPHP